MSNYDEELQQRAAEGSEDAKVRLAENRAWRERFRHKLPASDLPWSDLPDEDAPADGA